ncbi:MAG: signal peptide peptidase SppA [Flavobacteriaceae bacterium]
MNFLRTFFASVLGTLTALSLIIIFGLLILSGIASIFNSSIQSKTFNSKSVLNLNFNLPIVDRNPAFSEIQNFLGLNEDVIGLPNILSAIKSAEENTDIKGIRLRSDYINAGWPQTRSIRNALNNFKKTGKFIYAYGDFFTQKGYYLSSIADSIFLNPVGDLEFKGLASEVLYYKDFQDQYGFKMEVIRHGKYKSAVEPFLQNKMSNENKTQISSLLNDVWSVIKEEISMSRNLNENIIDKLASNNNFSIPQNAVNARLVDDLVYEDVFDQKIKTRLGIELNDKLGKVNISQINSTSLNYNSKIKDRIGVIFAEGPILYGEGTEDIVAQGVFVETINELAKDDWIKAVVVRVNSPGGSALTSELLWRSIEQLKKSKPVIVSIGNIAASGGYYIATGADYIFADPMSITGSIGVFATLPNVSNFLDNIGINAQTVQTHPNSLGYSPYQDINNEFKNRIKIGIENTYETFKNRVINGRSLDPNIVEKISQGRVWSGKQAYKLGLIDSLGGLQAAINFAAKKVSLDEYNVIEYPQFEESLEKIFMGITPEIQIKSPLEILIPKENFFNNQFKINRQQKSFLYTMLPFELIIK